MTEPRLLDRPAPLAARVVALRHLDAAADAGRRLLDREDDAALHDLRVALRRLEVWAGALRPHLADLSDKDLRRLRKVRRSTGALRDQEVRFAWLGDGERGWSATEQAARSWLLERERRGRRKRRRKASSRAADRVERLVGRLAPRLERYTQRLSGAGVPAPEAARAAVAAAAAPLRDALLARLRAVADEASHRGAHRARVAAKRLRYVLEPAAERAEPVAAAVAELRRLQTLLGDYHDGELLLAHVRAARAEAEADDETLLAGLTALAARLDAMAGVVWGEVAGGWLDDAGESFRGRLDGALAALAQGGAGAPAAEPDAEIERKFLLRGMPALPAGAEAHEMVQGWLPGERIHERLRCVTAGEGERWYRTVKLGSGLRRVEVEEEMDPALARQLWPLTEGRRVRKVRYRVPHGDLVWEVDRFADRDLVLAEVELPSEDADAPIPSWLEPVLEREVTGEAGYVNLNLAR